jgi:hypothetical protein
MDHLNIELKYGEIDDNIQKMLKEQLFVELLFKLLLTIFPTVRELYNLERIKQSKQNHLSNKRIALSEGLKGQGSNREPLPEHKQDLMDEILLEKEKILKKAYELIISISRHNPENQLYIKNFIPLMQAHAFFMPEIVIRIIELVEDNEELLLNLRKPQLNVKELDEKVAPRHAVIQETEKENIFDYEWIQWEASHLVKSLFETERISTGGWNIFYFFTNYMNDIDDLDRQKIILDFLIKVSTFEDKAINPNQEEIYKMMKNRFGGFLINKFYKFFSTDKVFYVTDRDTQKEHRLTKIFEKQRPAIQTMTKLNGDGSRDGVPMDGEEMIMSTEKKPKGVKWDNLESRSNS